MPRKVLTVIVLSLILVVDALSAPVLAAPRVVELIKPISDIKTVNKNIIISGWAEMDTTVEITVFSREVVNDNGTDVYKWKQYDQQGENNCIVVGPTGFFAKEIELKQGYNKVVIKAVSPSGDEETIEGEVMLSTKEEIREAVENLLNFNFIDIIKKIIQ